ncbi:hypothetical protein JOF53_005543 [Crossiella equi]|uniref:MmyB-like transcription regulator ligand binding domain-containing protein n=1 Tax=Crossiella equi TaxID=130796 RepID=A0ABS5AJC9_9PSEU|nr:hypothetical protein [Crossiella equi]MBP2476671.1 hypothetical protein [Crossiella equi]
MTAKTVAYLRATLGGDVGDPELRELIGELSLESDRFRVLWGRQDVRHQSSGLTGFEHPQVGPLDLRYEKFAVPGTTQVLVTYHADPGSASEEKLRLLGSLATSAAR